MKYKNVSLPYPVLGIYDDVYPLLTDDCIQMADPVKTATDYMFCIDLHQQNKDITQLVSEGKAEYACEVTCRSTFLRKCYKSSTPHFEISLGRTEVNGRIEFQCFIAASESIPNYNNSDFNEDYHGFTFDLEVGDMLAVFPLAWWNTNVKFDKLYAAQEDQKMIAGIKSAAKFKYGGKKLPKYAGGTEGDGTGNPFGLKLSIMDTVPKNQGGTIAPGTSPIRPYSDEFNGIEDLSNRALTMDYNVGAQHDYYTNIDHPDWFRAGVLRFADALNRAGKFANFSPGNEMVVNTNVNDFNNTIKAGSKFYTSNDFATPERKNYSTYAMYQPAVSAIMNSATFKKYYTDGKVNYKEAGAEGKFNSMLDELMYGVNTPGPVAPTDNTTLKSQDRGVNTNGIKLDENGYFVKPELNVARPEEPDDPVEDPNKPTDDNTTKSRELLTRGDAGLSEPTVDNSKSTEEDDDKTPGNEDKSPEDLTWEQLMNGGWEDPHQYDNEEGAYIRYHQAKANEPVEEINPRKYDMGKVTPGSYNRWSDDANLRKMQAAAVQTAASRGGGGSNAANAIAASLGFAGKQADIAAAKQRYDAAQIQEANRVNTEIERQNVTNRMKVDEMNMRSRARREDHAAQAAELRAKLAQSRKSDGYKARKEYIDGLTQFAGAARYMNKGERKMYMDALNRAFSNTGPGGYNARVASGSNGPTYNMSDETKAKLKKGADKAKAGVKKAWNYTKGKFKKIGKSKKK